MASGKKKRASSEFVSAGLASALVHCLVVALGCVNIFRPQVNRDMFLNIELAGAAEMQQAFDNYQEPTLAPEPPQPEEIIPPEPIQEESPQENSKPEPQIEESIDDQLVPGPTMIEPKESSIESDLQSEPEPQFEPEPEPEVENVPPSENALPQELQKEEIERKLEEEKQKMLEQQKQLEEAKERERIQIEKEKKRLKEKKKKAALKRKKRMEALKRIQKKAKSRKNRLAKIADAVKKNNESKARKKKKDSAFDKMIKNEKRSLNSGKSNSGNFGNRNGFGNGLGSYGDGMGITDSDAAIISSQIAPHWVVAGGVKNAETLIIRIRIKVKNNGEVPASSIEILDKERYNSDKVFRSAADSAKRAILQASPLKIPADKMHLFRDFEFSFNTDKALGVNR